MGEAVRKPGRVDRRKFLRLAAAAGLSSVLAACTNQRPGELDQAVAPTSTAALQPEPVVTTPLASRQPAKPSETAMAPVATRPPAEPSETATAAARNESQQPKPTPTGQQAYLAVARGSVPSAITRAALAALGGMERFVKAGDDVIVKPNLCVDYRTYEYAATTNPEVVATLVELCLAAGAKRVRVMDSPFAGSAENAYARSGIADAVKAVGGQMEIMNPAKYREAPIPEGRDIRKWSIYQAVLDADVLIDVPIAKQHSVSRLTLAGKNLLGVIQKPGLIHANLGQRIADLVSAIRPTLTVVDAVRILLAHGPSGGSLNDVQLANTVIASHDIVAADAYAATLFGLSGSDISYVKAAAEMGLGTLDLKAIRIEEVAL